ncbi:hypothetical protein [Catenovulum sediminis]|uniref:hypothetical protein n=1 Tax=Catenovulum sediminis TaxID=1740262 RepID=UPI001181093D|nr:hypothetical protein [Catenovulum sediminis]
MYFAVKNKQNVSQKVHEFLAQLQSIEPQQYYYPANELHLTILSIISCVAGFKLNDIQSERYVDIFLQCMHKIKPIEIHFAGVTASSSCVSTAHVTAVRLKTQMRDAQHFVDVLNGHRKHDFGYIRLTEFDLVFNNWYQNLSETQNLAHWSVGKTATRLVYGCK